MENVIDEPTAVHTTNAVIHSASLKQMATSFQLVACPASQTIMAISLQLLINTVTPQEDTASLSLMAVARQVPRLKTRTTCLSLLAAPPSSSGMMPLAMKSLCLAISSLTLLVCRLGI